MKLTILLILVLLSGCAQSAPEATLNRYASLAANGDLSEVLVGSALAQAEKSREFLRSQQLVQAGLPAFVATARQKDGTLLSCLDVSGVEFLDASGAPKSFARTSDRVLLRVEFAGDKIASLEEAGTC
jgi:hypothetical protein